MQTTTNNNIKIVRLHGGEDIIADYIQDDENEKVLLNNPMQVIFKRINSGQVVMMMMPWLPLEIIKSNQAILDIADILTTVDPKDDAIKHYAEVVLEAQERMEHSFSTEEDEEDDEEDERELEGLSVDEMIDMVRNKDKKKLH
jgi:hypothetical protein